MSQRPAGFLGPLSKFVLEVLPWALSSLIGLYLLWSFWLAPSPAGLKPVAEQPLPAYGRTVVGTKPAGRRTADRTTPAFAAAGAAAPSAM